MEKEVILASIVIMWLIVTILMLWREYGRLVFKQKLEPSSNNKKHTLNFDIVPAEQMSIDINVENVCESSSLNASNEDFSDNFEEIYDRGDDTEEEPEKDFSREMELIDFNALDGFIAEFDAPNLDATDIQLVLDYTSAPDPSPYFHQKEEIKSTIDLLADTDILEALKSLNQSEERLLQLTTETDNIYH